MVRSPAGPWRLDCPCRAFGVESEVHLHADASGGVALQHARDCETRAARREVDPRRHGPSAEEVESRGDA